MDYLRLAKALIEQQVARPKGLSAALASVKKTSRVCPCCGMQVPQYTGRYPDKCPDCGSEFKKVGS